MSDDWLKMGEGHTDWDQALDHFPDPSFSMLYGWRMVYEKALGLKTFYLMVSEKGKGVQGLCPLVLMRSPWIGRGAFLISLPYMTRAGICVRDAKSRELVLGLIREKARELKADFVELRELSVIDELSSFPSNREHIQMMLALPQLWPQYEKTIAPRLRQVKKAQQAGLTIKRGQGEKLLADFYGVFSQRMKELVFPVYPKEYFKTILETFPGQAELLLVYDQSTPLGGMLLFRYQETCSAPYVATLIKGQDSHPNQLLYYSAIRQAWEEGFRFFDFCRSQVGSGTYNFKSQWKAKPKELVYSYPVCKDRNHLPTVGQAQHSWSFQIAEKIWPRLPLPLTQWLGRRLIRQLVLA
jgi:serine/alanine adding enzyme